MKHQHHKQPRTSQNAEQIQSLQSWFKLYFNCYKYKHILTENIKYPGSDKKPKACPKVISWQVDIMCTFYKWSKSEKHLDITA